MLKRTQEPSGVGFSSRIVHREEAKPIVIDAGDVIYSVAIFADGKHVVSGCKKGKIRRWRTEDGKEMGTAMKAGSAVFNIGMMGIKAGELLTNFSLIISSLMRARVSMSYRRHRFEAGYWLFTDRPFVRVTN